VNREDFLYSLELKDQDVINQKIESQLFLENEAFILQFDPKLSDLWNLTKLTLATEAFFCKSLRLSPAPRFDELR
jgi:hypothetical protein